MSGVENQRLTSVVRVLLCRVGRAPVVEYLAPDDDGEWIDTMERIVGGRVTVTFLQGGIDLYYNDYARAQRLPVNRVIPTTMLSLPRALTAAAHLTIPGKPDEVGIYGDFFLAREVGDGEIDSLTDADIERFQALWS